MQHNFELLKKQKILDEILQFKETEAAFLPIWGEVFGALKKDIEFLRFKDSVLVVAVKKTYLNYEISQNQRLFLDKLNANLSNMVVKRINVRYDRKV